jgi:hypothetical protein
MIVYLPTMIAFNISTIVGYHKRILLILGENSSCDLEDEGRR